MTFMKLSSLVFVSSITTFNLHSMQKPQQAKTKADIEFEQTCNDLPPIVNIRLSSEDTTSGILDASLQVAKQSKEKPQRISSSQQNSVYQALNTPEAIAHYKKMHAYFSYLFMVSTNSITPSHHVQGSLARLPLIPTSATAKGSEASNK